jgi:hypothetical protein
MNGLQVVVPARGQPRLTLTLEKQLEHKAQSSQNERD